MSNIKIAASGTRLRVGRMLFATLLLSTFATVHAQGAPERSAREDGLEVKPRRAENSTSAAEGPIRAATLPEVKVTGTTHTTALDSDSATRTDTPLIDVPQSVQVITRSLIDDQDLHTLGNALVNVSGVTPTRSDEILFIPPIVRGFPARSISMACRSSRVTSRPMTRTAWWASSASRCSRDQAPRSMAAAWVRRSAASSISNPSGRATRLADTWRCAHGSYGTENPSVDLTGPLTSTINGRLAADYQSNDSWIDKVHGKRWSVQPSLSFKIDDATDLLLQGQFNHLSNLEYSGLPADEALAGALDRDAFPGSPIDQSLTKNDSHMGTATLRHDFSDRVKLTVTGRTYADNVNESGSFVYPGLVPSGSTPPVYDVFPITMVTRTRETTFDAHLAAKVDMLGGNTRTAGRHQLRPDPFLQRHGPVRQR